MKSHSSTNNNASNSFIRKRVSLHLFLSDAFAMLLAFGAAYLTAPFLKTILEPDIGGEALSHFLQRTISWNDLFLIWMFPLVLLTLLFNGHYTKRLPWWGQVRIILALCCVAFIIDGFTRFALNMNVSRLLIGLSWVYTFAFILIGRQLVYKIATTMKIWCLPTIIIGDIETITDTLYAFHNDPYTGYDVTCVYVRDREGHSLSLENVPSAYKNITVIYDKPNLKSFIANNTDFFFILSLETFRGQERDDVISALNQNNVLYAIAPSISRMSIYDMEPVQFFGNDVMLLHTKRTIFSPLGQFIKRSIDLILGIPAVLVAAPIIALLGGCLKIEGQNGSLFFAGERIGRHGRHFKCWKIRTMDPESEHLLQALLNTDPKAKAEWDTYRKLKNDPRVKTKTARFIRKTSLDELPQLWNVIKGDMSLVGPRPILPEELKRLNGSHKNYYKLRPGITGLWQVSGRNHTSFERRVYWDNWYARNWSIWGDLVILIKTVRVIIGDKSAY